MGGEENSCTWETLTLSTCEYVNQCCARVFPGTREPDPWQKYYRTGPGTARKSMQVLEPDPEPPGGSSQF